MRTVPEIPNALYLHFLAGLLLVGLLHASPMHAQGWQRVATDNYGAAFVDDQTIVVVGGFGKIIRSTDGGLHWTQPESNTHYTLYAVAYLGDGRLVAVGDSGIVLSSNNAGATWVGGNVGVAERLLSVTFPTSTRGYACGTNGTILTSTDGGKTWQQRQSTTTRQLQRIASADSITIVAVGSSGTTVRTTDGGESWTAQQMPTNLFLYAIAFADGRHGTIAGYNGICFGTDDAGATWRLLNADTAVYRRINALWMIDSNHLIGVGDRINDSKIARSSDGGRMWEWDTAFDIEEHWAIYNDVIFHTPSHGVVVGIQASIKITDDGGMTWRTVSYTPFNTSISDVVNAMEFADRDVGLALFGNSYLRTTDGGITWKQFHVLNLGNSLVDLQFLSHDRALLAGSYYRMFLSTDQGLTWDYSDATVDPFAVEVSAMHFTDATFGSFLCANRAYTTSDGGRSWHGAAIPQLSGADSGIAFNVYTPRPDVLYVTALGWQKDNPSSTYHTSLYRTIDAGAHWQEILNQPGANALTRTWFIDRQHGFVGGNYGIIYRTSDGGDSWDSVATEAPGGISDLKFYSASVGYAVTFRGAVLFTSDGGGSWKRELISPTQPEDTTTPFYRINILPDRQTVMITGVSMMLRKRLSEPIPATVPGNLAGTPGEATNMLVFPNPANNFVRLYLTNIDLQDRELHVYDASGREITRCLHSLSIDRISHTAQAEIDCTVLSNGAYYVMAEHEGHHVGRPFTVVR